MKHETSLATIEEDKSEPWGTYTRSEREKRFSKLEAMIVKNKQEYQRNIVQIAALKQQISNLKRELQELKARAIDDEKPITRFNPASMLSDLEMKLSRLSSINANLKLDNIDYIAEQEKLRGVIDQERFFSLPKEQLKKVEKIGNVICPSFHDLQKLYLLFLSCNLDIKSKTRSKDFNISAARETDKIIISINAAVHGLMSVDEKGGLKVLNQSAANDRKQKKALHLIAKKNAKSINAMYKQWKKTLSREEYEAFKALAATSSFVTRLGSQRKAFIPMLKFNGNGGMYFPLINYLFAIINPLNTELNGVIQQSLTLKEVTSIEQKFERLKQQIKSPESNCVINTVAEMLVKVRQRVDERARVTKTVTLHPRKPKPAVKADIPEPSTRKKRVRFAVKSMDSPTLTLINGLGLFTAAKPANQDRIVHHKRHRTVG